QQFPGTTFAFLPADIVSQVLNFGAPAPIDLQVAGRDLAADRKYANALLAKVREVPGIADARIQQAFAQPTLNVNVDRSLTALVGLSEKDVANAMLTTLSGSSQSAPTYWLDPTNGVSYAVSVQTPQRDIDTMSGLKNIPITSPSANIQLLGGLANVERTNSNAVVSHYNVQPVIDIYATPQGRDLGALASDIQKLIHATAQQLPKGASVTLRGQVTTMTSAYRQLYVGLAAAIVLIYLLIVVNFQSWADPFVIIMALPTALAGIVWILFATGTTLSVPALTGAIMCMGVATANSILVISFARDQMAAGLDATAAAFEAGRARFRPVMMTALAMVIGMVPMAIEPGQNTPLGRAVIGGLIFATCATLVLVPAIFSLVHSRQHGSANQPAAATAP
ncbi:MAG: hypothetical protein QOG73_3136, partial [Acetobacteraceae bacterium]|nr:hypothetical protein [Acetobacteraceae bacterium]